MQMLSGELIFIEGAGIILHLLLAHRSSGRKTEGIIYPSVVSDPPRHSKIHEITVLIIPPGEVLSVGEMVVPLSLSFGTELWSSINSRQLNRIDSYQKNMLQHKLYYPET